MPPPPSDIQAFKTDSASAGKAWLNAEQAARILGISRATLYAYVSRGLLTAEAAPGSPGTKRYRSSEVQRLAQQRQHARRPRLAARDSLDWGLPVLASALTLIEGGQLYYRGKNALHLAEDHTLEAVAALLWQCPESQSFLPELASAALRWPEAAVLAALAQQPLNQRCVSAAALLQTQAAISGGPLAADASACGALLCGLVALILGTRPHSAPVHVQLQQAWGLNDNDGQALRRALVLCADHELNASSFTARCVAATGAPLAACLSAALLALSGPRHGGMTELVEGWWPHWTSASSIDCKPSAITPGLADSAGQEFLLQWDREAGPERQAMAEQPAPQALPGFGHPLYPEGDPRAHALLQGLPQAASLPALQAQVRQATGLHPALDLALVALRRHLGLPRGSAFAIFAIGRTVGWLAHALEQRGSSSLIRPRAEYTGPQPEAPASQVAPAGRIVRRR